MCLAGLAGVDCIRHRQLLLLQVTARRFIADADNNSVAYQGILEVLELASDG